MWVDKKTAFLVVHGVGEQNPYESLDSFVRNFWDLLKEENKAKITGHHKHQKRNGWIDNYVSLGIDKASKPDIDFYEYYWAHIPQRKVNLQEIYDWLLATSKGAKEFYDENNELAAKYEGLGSKAFENGTFKKHWYLKHVSLIFRLLTLVKSIPLIEKIPLLKYLEPLISLFIRKAEKLIIDYIGDVVVYTSTDIKAKTFETRKQILGGAVERLRLLIEDDRYEQIIVVGHSLGTVISYDALNRINLEMNVDETLRKKAEKVTGFITFGSPLDKIAFFFRERTVKDEFIRRQILEHFHGFKSLSLNTKKDKIKISNPYEPYLDKHVYWMNFWDNQDPVSGNLDFYKVDENILLEQDSSFGFAHTTYWSHQKMYKKIADSYLKPS